ncbi:MAG: DUF177 domain-containing protein [Clostridia bacterium]|nr:DUF177 domain-containing protein [Clostridia bacterium]
MMNEKNTQNGYKIDVSKIYNGENKEIAFDFELAPENLDKMDFSFEKPPKVCGRAYEKARGKGKTDSYVGLEFEISGRYLTHCARCYADIERDLFISKEYDLVKKTESENEDIIEVPQNVLDIEELAYTVFYLELPFRVLCKEDCKGLCENCGKNLNEGPCTCKKDHGTNSLAELKKLLDN